MKKQEWLAARFGMEPPGTESLGKWVFRLLALLLLGALGGACRAEAQLKDVIEFSPFLYRVLENSNRVSLQLVRRGTLLDFAQVRVETVADTAKEGVDYSKFAEDITFAPGQSNYVVEVEILNDVEAEGAETFHVTLVSTDPFCCVLGQNTQAWVTIDDNDRGVQFASTFYQVREEAGELRVVVERISDQAGESGSVWFDIVDQNATRGIDYSIASDEVMFAAGQTQAVITIQIFNDHLPEPPKTFLLVFRPDADPFCCLLGETKQTQIIINDNDRGVEFSQYQYLVNEQTPRLGITLQRGGDFIAEAGWVTWVVEELGARLDEDFVVPERSIFFPAGESNVTIYISVVNDALREDLESFRLSLSNDPTNLPVGSQQSAVIGLIDNDSGVEFVRAEYRAMENGGPISIDLQRLGEPTNAFSVELLVSGSALSGVDFQLLTNRLFFGPGQTNLSMPLPILDDPFVDGDKTLTLTLSHATANVPLGTNAVCTVRIQENEHPMDLVDASFKDNIGGVSAAVRQPDGKIVVGTPLRRLSGEGSPDGTFALFAPVGAFTHLALQPDGKVIGAGPIYFNWLGTDYHFFARFNTNGELDASVVPELTGDGLVRCLQLLPDGRLLLGGTLFRPDGFRAGLVRFSSSGAWEREFQPEIQDAEVRVVVRQTDGKIVIGGPFITVQGSARPGLARLTAGGALDSTFNARFASGTAVETLALLGNGDLLVGFTEPDGKPGLARCHGTTGLRSASFEVGFGENSSVSAMLVPPDGRIFLLGHLVGPAPNQPARIAQMSASGSAMNFRSAVGEGLLLWAPPHLLTLKDGHLIRLLSEMPEYSLAFSSADFYAEEGAGSAVIAVERGGNTVSNLTVGVTASGLSVNRGELLPDRSTVQFEPFEVRKEITLQLANDCRSEPPEIVQLQFTNAPPGGVLAAPAQARLLIADDDAPGSLDEFNPLNETMGGSPGPQPAGSIGADPLNWGVAMALQPDGKIVLADDGYITRVNSDGTPDASFVEGARLCASLPFANIVNCGVNVLALEQDGHILAGGYGGIMRLHPDGRVDTNFVVTALVYQGHGTYTPGTITSLIVQSDGRIVATSSGLFTTIGGMPGLARLNPDGTPDFSFVVPRASGTPNRLALLPDGRYLVAYSQLLQRYLTNGARDQTFTTVFFNSALSDLRLLPDGQILVTGGFTVIGGQPRQGIARLTADGQLDPGFNPQLSPTPAEGQIAVQAVALLDDEILAAVQIAAEGTTNVHVGRLAADGRLDPLFNSGLRYSGAIRQLLPQPDGKVLVSGLFDAVGFTPRPGIARLVGERPTVVCQAPTSAGQPFRIVTTSEPQSRYVLQGSDELVEWNNLATNLAHDCTLEFQDARPAVTARFYRVRKLTP